MAGKAMFNFTDRTVLISGGGTGIGAGIADPRRTLDKVIERHGRLDILVNMTGHRLLGRLEHHALIS
jgi:NAD(P)-dependent dehydrogenase (short-subunit alcohol dehydrogenase family)